MLIQVVIVAAAVGFIAGILFQNSDNSYFQVLKSYMQLHWVHRVEALHMSRLARQAGLDIVFTSPTEQTALATSVVAMLTYAVGRRQLSLQT